LQALATLARIISLDRIAGGAKVRVLLVPFVAVQEARWIGSSPNRKESERGQIKVMANGKWWVAVGIALCFVPYGLAQQTLELTGVNGNNYAGIYIGPYDIQVGHNGPTSGMICDDFNDDVGIGNTWTAKPVSVSGGTLSQTMFGGQQGALQGYEEVAALSYAILFNNQSSTTTALMQYAIWAIFSPTQVQNWLKANDGSNYASDWATIQSYITWAGQHGSQSLLSQFVVWTPQGCKSGTCGAQEMFQYVPEGGTALIYLLLAGIFCFGAMWIKSRGVAGTLQIR
jgi:hypothetical protein